MSILIIVLLSAVLVSLSALCSGLNVALLALDPRDLARKAKLGDRHSKRALNIRKDVHFYLAGILFANVAFASATSVVLTDSFSGLMAVIISTILLVVFAEITPQAIAVKHSTKAISAFSMPIRIVTYLAYPVTKSLEILLNRYVGKAGSVLQSRRELNLLIAEHYGQESELDEDEVEIVRSALMLSEKRVREIMTPLQHVYFLYEETEIDSKKVTELKNENWSRVPIFNRDKTECNAFIMLKDLVDIDFSHKSYKISELTTHKSATIGSMTALDTLFRKFITAKRHMLIVEKDDKIAGIVTIEDLLEEIIGHEIEDESDE